MSNPTMTRRRFMGLLGALGAGLLIQNPVKPTVSMPERFDVAGEVVGGQTGMSKFGHLVRGPKDMSAFPDPESHVYDTVIVGGGIAGVSAAWKLKRSGVENFLIMDLADELGGTAVAGEGNGTEFAWAAHYINTPDPGSECIVEILEDLGVINGFDDFGWPQFDAQYKLDGIKERLLVDDTWVNQIEPVGHGTNANDVDEVAFAGFEADMLQWQLRVGSDGKRAFALPMEYSSSDMEIRDLDKITMKEYMRSKGWYSDRLDWYVNYGMRDDFGCPFDEVSAWAGIHYYACRNYSPKAPGKVETATWPEGNAFLLRGLAKDLAQDQVLTNAIGLSIRHEGDLVHVTYGDTQSGDLKTLSAKTVIFGGKKFVAPFVVDDLPQVMIDAFRATSYTPWITASVYVSEHPVSKRSFVAWDNVAYDSKSLGYILASHQKGTDPSEPTVLSYYRPLDESPAGERVDLLAATHEDLVQVVMQDLWQMHPGIESIVQKVDVRKWGHAMPRPTPGFLFGDHADARNASHGQIFFANCDGTGLPLFEEAAFNGIRAAQQAMENLGVDFVDSI